MQDWRSQSQLIPASELEDTNVLLAEPEPRTWGTLTLVELQHRLKLDWIFDGTQITRVIYRDRYIYSREAEILSHLLQIKGIGSGTQILIRTRDDHPNKQNLIPRPVRETQLKTHLNRLKSSGATLQIDVQPYQSANLPHARTLEVSRQDGQQYRVAFEKGVDFLRITTNGMYQIKDQTYLVITHQS